MYTHMDIIKEVDNNMKPSTTTATVIVILKIPVSMLVSHSIPLVQTEVSQMTRWI